MAKIKLKGNPVTTSGDLPAVGSTAKDFSLVALDLSEKGLSSFPGKKKVLNVYPSLDTPTCATSVKSFHAKIAGRDDVVVLNISADLPFAGKRFCAAEGIENAHVLSTFRNASFMKDYGLQIVDSPLAGLCSRAVIVVDENGKILHTEQVGEIADEPNYDAALKVL
jgi:thioredoxin-dependent peroxiredoxin